MDMSRRFGGEHKTRVVRDAHTLVLETRALVKKANAVKFSDTSQQSSRLTLDNSNKTLAACIWETEGPQRMLRGEHASKWQGSHDTWRTFFMKYFI